MGQNSKRLDQHGLCKIRKAATEKVAAFVKYCTFLVANLNFFCYNRNMALKGGFRWNAVNGLARRIFILKEKF